MGGKNSKDKIPSSSDIIDAEDDTPPVLELPKGIEDIFTQEKVFFDNPLYRKRLERYYGKRKRIIANGGGGGGRDKVKMKSSTTSDSALIKRNKNYGFMANVSCMGKSEPNLKHKFLQEGIKTGKEAGVIQVEGTSPQESPNVKHEFLHEETNKTGKEEGPILLEEKDTLEKQSFAIQNVSLKTSSSMVMESGAGTGSVSNSPKGDHDHDHDHHAPITSILQSIEIKSRIPKPIQKQRSAFTSNSSKVDKTSNLDEKSRQKSEDSLLQCQKPKSKVKATSSTGKDWAPVVKYSYSSMTSRPTTATLDKSAIPEIEKPSHSSIDTASKNKLVVRGLRSFVNSRRRIPQTESTSSYTTSTSTSTTTSTSSRGRPKLWDREFPEKGKFHPDRYIYDFDEGPKRPARPYSAMAKCRRHGGKCDHCGISTCDLCQSCRKCEVDCDCPKKSTEYPYTNPAEVYSQVLGGDAWKKTCKVFCDLTEKEKMNPVGGKWSQVQRQTRRMDPSSRNHMYNSQIDVLNPYRISQSDREDKEDLHMVPPSPLPPMMYPPMCGYPSMYPMPFMPMMMPPPMYYPPPPPMLSPPPFFPPNDDPFLPPPQNYA